MDRVLRRFSEKLNQKEVKYFVLFIWLIEQIYYFNKYNGVRIVFDSHRYLRGALHWKHFNPFYSYSAIISPFAHTDFLIGITFLQITLNFIALFCFLKLIQSASENSLVLLVGGLMFLWPELQLWNFYIHSESLFISISVYIIYFFTFKKYKWAITTMLILCFLRPNGFIFLLAFIFFYILKKYEVRKLIFPSIIILGIIFLALTDFVIPKLNNYPFMLHLMKGKIIQGSNLWTIDNTGLTYCKDCTNSIKIITLIINNPWFYFKFWTSRIVILFSQVRPYYRTVHNIGVVLLFIPVYYFAGKYIWKEKFKKYSFLLLPIIFEVCIVLIGGVDWDNRFLVIILPCVFLLSTFGFDSYLNEKTKLKP